MSLFQELKRRKVFRVAVAYAVVAWLLAQVAGTIFPVLLLPDWLLRAFFVFLFLGFPMALLLAWSYELTPEGVVRDDEDERQMPAAVPGGWTYFLIGAATLGTGLLIGGWLSSGSTVIANTQSAQLNDMPTMQIPLHLGGFMHSAYPTEARSITMSNDGSRIAYIGFQDGARRLFVRESRTSEARVMPDTANATNPIISPNGEWLAYFAENEIRRIAIGGDSAAVIAATVGESQGADWGDSSLIVYSAGYRGALLAVPETGGEAEELTTLREGEVSHRFPEFLPGGDALYFQVNLANPSIWHYDMKSRTRTRITDGRMPRFANETLFFLRGPRSNAALWAAPIDMQSGELSGEPRLLAGNLARGYDVAASGELIYAKPRTVSNRRLVVIGNDGIERVLHSGDAMNAPKFSPDGEMVAVQARIDNESNVWVFSVSDGSPAIQVTKDGGGSPVWSPDGTRIAYAEPGTGIVAKGLSGNDAPELIVPFADAIFPVEWTEDGLLYTRINQATQGDLYFLHANGETTAIDEDVEPVSGASLSPDRQHIVYPRWVSGLPRLTIKSFPDGGTGQRVWSEYADTPKWSRDGSKIFFVSYNRIMSLGVVDSNGPTFDEPETVYEMASGATIISITFDLHPDGKTIVVIDTSYDEGAQQMYVSDWRKVLDQGR